MSQEDPIILSDDEDTQPIDYEEAEDAKENQKTDTMVRADKKRGGDAFHGKRFRNWFFTWNNPSMPTDKDQLLGYQRFRYVKFQLERGKEGTPHLQGMFMLREAATCSSLIKIFGFGFLEPLKSEDGASKYVGKKETRIDGPWEAGTPPRQGHRSDLDGIKAIIDGGGSIKDVFDSYFGSAIRYHSGIRVYHSLVNKQHKRDWQTSLFICWGKKGTGKSAFAAVASEYCGGGVYNLNLQGGMMNKVWWTGYDGEENVIIDEFHCQMNLQDFNKMIDRQPWMVPVHGGMVNFKAKRVFITANSDPWGWYSKVTGERRDAFLSRCGYALPDENGTPTKRRGVQSLVIKYDQLFHGQSWEDYEIEVKDMMDELGEKKN